MKTNTFCTLGCVHSYENSAHWVNEILKRVVGVIKKGHLRPGVDSRDNAE